MRSHKHTHNHKEHGYCIAHLVLLVFEILHKLIEINLARAVCVQILHGGVKLAVAHDSIGRAHLEELAHLLAVKGTCNIPQRETYTTRTASRNSILDLV